MERRLTALIKGKPADLSGLVERGNALSAENDALQAAIDKNKPRRLSREQSMATAQEQIATLTTQVTTATTVEKSAQTLIEGIQARIDAAVTAAIANGATAEQLQPVSDLSAVLDAESTALAAAVQANTPAA
jgi:predicted  nucleic acid-binding Zn-ribbon protein